MDEEVRWYKGPPSLAITEHWNYCDEKDFHGGYMLAGTGSAADRMGLGADRRARAVGSTRCATAMLDYNHMIGVKMVGEMLPDEREHA